MREGLWFCYYYNFLLKVLFRDSVGWSMGSAGEVGLNCTLGHPQGGAKGFWGPRSKGFWVRPLLPIPQEPGAPEKLSTLDEVSASDLPIVLGRQSGTQPLAP